MREEERENFNTDEVLSAAQINNRLNLSVDVEELKNFATHQLLLPPVAVFAVVAVVVVVAVVAADDAGALRTSSTSFWR